MADIETIERRFRDVAGEVRTLAIRIRAADEYEMLDADYLVDGEKVPRGVFLDICTMLGGAK